MMNRFQTLLSIPTCAPSAGDPRGAIAALRAAASAALRRAPALIVIDDLDSVAASDPGGGGGGAPSSGETVGEVFADMMDAAAATGAAVAFLATAAAPECVAGRLFRTSARPTDASAPPSSPSSPPPPPPPSPHPSPLPHPPPPPPHQRVYMSIHTQDKTCSNIDRVLALNDPPSWPEC
jgi:hypothetical protein